jgi:4-phytase/acid phosphatase
MRALVVVTFAAACVLTTVRFPAAADSASAPGSLPPSLRAVVIVTRHGVRSPTDPTELAAYVVHPWPAWEVAPGYLTPHGATLMTSFGAAYRAYYAAKGLLPPQGCPQSGSV